MVFRSLPHQSAETTFMTDTPQIRRRWRRFKLSTMLVLVGIGA